MYADALGQMAQHRTAHPRSRAQLAAYLLVPLQQRVAGDVAAQALDLLVDVGLRLNLLALKA